MALQLILGPAASGKTTQLEQEIKAIAESNPQQTVLYIVPEQTTRKVEQRLLETVKSGSLLNVAVVSFNRLAHRVVTEVGMPEIKMLDDMGKSMVLYKIVMDHQKELGYYGASAGKKGFIGQLTLMITELFQYALDEEALSAFIQEQPGGSILRAKLEDIRLIWQYFNAYTEQEMLASEALLDLLAERIERSRLIREAVIYIDDFSGFTPQQYRILTGLAMRSRRLTIAITLPPAVFKQVEEVQDWRELPRQTFFTTAKTVWKLLALARQYRLPYQIRWQSQVYLPQEIAHAAWQLQRVKPLAFDGPARRVRGYAAPTQAQELRQVFHEILHLVRDKGYAYREIAVVVTDLASYAHALRRQMALHQIPGFIDEKVDITLNPYVQWMQSLGEWATTGFSGEGFMSILKTGLCGIEADAMDRLENVCLKENWQGLSRIIAGLQAQEMPMEHQDGQLDLWEGPLTQLARGLEAFAGKTKGRQRAQELTKAYQELAQNLQIEQRLAERAGQLEVDGMLLLAMEYERIYDMASKVQEQLDQIMGDTRMTLKEYRLLLEMGLSQTKLGQLPPSLDELLVADLSRSKLAGYRAVFILGLQEGCFPKTAGSAGLLSQAERAKVQFLSTARPAEQRELAQGDKEDVSEQYFLFYLAMSKAKERLYLFCSQNGSDGKAYGESLVWKRMKRALGEGYLMPEANDVTGPQALLYENPTLALGPGGAWFMQHGFEHTLQLMQRARAGETDEKPLPPAIAHRLMDPSQRQLSITQLEQYARCPFSYYLRYGLSLEEREVPQVRSLEEGNALHDILQEAGRFLSQALSQAQAQEIAGSLAEQKQAEYAVYQTSSRYRYYWRKLQKTAARALLILSEQVQRGDFTPAAFEWRFGGGAGLAGPVEVRLAGGKVVRLQGKIDRIDLWQQEEQRYFRIIDYKSGQVSLDPQQMYAGLQLQLPVYMEAAEKAYHAIPAGVFYFHLTPVVQSLEQPVEDFKKLTLMSGRLDGLFLEEIPALTHMDTEWEAGSDSVVIKAHFNKKEKALKKTDQAVSQEQLAALRLFTHRKIAEVAQQMEEGHIEAQPVKLGTDAACQYCEYRLACPFDDKLSRSGYRRLPKMNMQEFWEAIEEE